MAIGAICGLADPVGGAVVFAIVIAFLFTLVRQKTRMASDTAISVFSSAAVALGIFISTMGGQSFTKFNSLLIGDILSVSPAEIGLLAIILILVVILLFMLRRRVVLPTRALLKANHALASGNTDYRLQPETAGSAEFQSLYDSFNEMSEQIVQLRIQAYDMKLQEEQHKLTMLRAQIRPHSFLNAITTMSNMTYGSKPEEIRGYISAFAKFIRYMLNVSAPFTTVGDEIRQIRNYLAMQQSRFPDSVHLTVDCPEELADSKVPFLLLYTLVENSIKHAMTLYETLHVSLCCRRVETENFRGICLIQEDDGAGFPAHVLEELRQENTGELNTKEHLGLSNVRYTLHLVYRRGDLLRASNRETGGAHVEIWIPDEEKI
jgi:sensor histidine kinase YesM